MKLRRLTGIAALSLALAGPCFAQTTTDTGTVQPQTKEEKQAAKAQKKADKLQKKASKTKQQKKADKAQDKADKAAAKAGSPPPE